MPFVFSFCRRSNLRCAALAAFALLAVGCTYEHTRQKTQSFLRQSHLATDYQIKRSDNWVLSSETPVCLVSPNSGEQPASTVTRPRAHQQLSQSLYEALAQHFVVVQVPQGGALYTTAQASALQGCSVMILPHIMDARDQLNSWVELDQDLGIFANRTPGADKLVVRIAIYSILGTQPLDIATIHGRTGFWTLSRRTPNDLFDDAMQAYVASISNKPHAG